MDKHRPAQRALGPTWLLAATLLLTACGGGGGGSGGDSRGGAIAAPSLVPTPPALGDVLAADAAELRPLSAGMRWYYDGTFTHAGSTGPGSLYNSTVALASGAAGLEESSSGVFLEASTQVAVLAVTNGQVTRSESITPLSGAPTVRTTSTELRSPVRAGDQYVVFEQSKLALDSDVDGDNVKDTVDAAVYRLVRDRGSVTLPAIGRTIDAIRVEDHYAYRINLSATKTTSPVYRAVETTWYAPRVGVVRRSLTALGEGSAGAVEYDEVLRGFDGLSTGLGMLDAVPLPVPAGQRAQSLLAHAVVGEHVMTVTGITEASGEQGLRVSVVDKSGHAVATSEYAAWRMSVNQRPSLVAIGQRAVLAWVEPMIAGSNGWPWNVRIVALDSTGKPVGPISGQVVLQAAVGVTTATDGRNLWLVWARERGSSLGYELVAQPFDTAGNPLEAVQVLDASTSIWVPTVRVAAGADGRVTVIWSANVTHDIAIRHAVLRLGLPPAVRELGLSSLYSIRDSADRLLIGSQAALWTWGGRYFTPYDASAPASNTALRVALLEPSSSWPVAGTGSLLDTLLLSDTFSLPGETPAVGLDGSTAYFASMAHTAFNPGDYSKAYVTQLSAVRMDSLTRLSDGSATTWRWRQSQAWGANVCMAPKAVIPYSDRLLLLCEGTSLVVFK